MLDKILEILGIDFHVGITLLLRSWGVLAGVFMLLWISYWLSTQEQGYYFTFISLLSLQIFFELGIGQVISQLVSRELARSPSFNRENYKINRLASIVFLTRRWYKCAAVLFAVVAGTVGVFLFGKSGGLDADLWLGPWLVLVLMTAINIYFGPLLAIIEGAGQIGQVARLRLLQSIAGYCFAWGALYAGAGLWSVVLLPFVAVLFNVYWINTGDHLLMELKKASANPERNPIVWKTEVFPMQWRIAISWISGYLMFQLFTPLVFYFDGAIAAGQLGMGLAIFNAVLSVGVSWVNAKTPAFTRLIVLHERLQLNVLFKNVVKRSVGFVLVVSFILLFIIYVFKTIGLDGVERLTSLSILTCLAIVTVVNTLVYSAACYMRAHGEEPMLAVSITGAVGTILIIVVFLNYSLELTMIVYTLFTISVPSSWTLRLFLSYYRRAG